ncbi:uncharacterized protein A1O5_07489 [Cladophialophora psammophila CBS 110553]|uniref:4Fe-4S ferredoxin-type domain-containing protein n=1 Tax=Cladophialophora psammophila CBS 110553 TaxID=1182543 RepID=W9WNL3_9EURO|nr:uncharacterized protein A1O5_07489 [Cladophialophora psammophila CBS 110553]EXJ69453.1 hypothetical protein A1O5_07489 [Cladophialophora psammophila CBS 110553]
MKGVSLILVAVSILVQSISALTVEKGNSSPVGAGVSDNNPTPIPIESDNEGSVTCNECIKDAGICCPVQCQSDGKCPSIAVENAGWLIDGIKITSNSKKH